MVVKATGGEFDFKRLYREERTNSRRRPLSSRRSVATVQTPLPSGAAFSTYRPNTAEPSIKSALTVIRNEPPANNDWLVDMFKAAGEGGLKGLVWGVDNTVGRVDNAFRNVLYNWTDDELSWGDVPFVSGFQGLVADMSPNSPERIDTEDFLNRADVGDFQGRGAVEFLGDLLAPSTFLTFGAGSAAKFAGQGAKAAAKQGLKEGTESFDDFVQRFSQAKAANQAVSIDIPFGPSWTLLEKRGPLRVTAQTIGSEPARSLSRRLDNLRLTHPQKQSLVSSMVGRPINDLSELNTQEFDFVVRELNDGVGTRINNARSTAINFDNELARIGQDASQRLQVFEGADGVSQIGKTLRGNQLVEDLGRMFGGKRYVPVSSRLADHRIPQAVDMVSFSRLGGFSNAREAVEKMARLTRDPAIRNLTPDELNLIPYEIEGKWPQSIPRESIAPDRLAAIERAADLFRQYRDEFTSIEQSANVPYAPRPDYFPHILNVPQEGVEFEAFINELRALDPDLASRIESRPPGFTRQRKAFDTMADLTDYLERHANNPRIQKLFGNATFNPIEALGRRAMSGAQAVAKMKAYEAVQEMGLLRQFRKGTPVPSGWKRVDIPGLRNAYAPKEVVDRINDLSTIMINDATAHKFLDKAEKIYNVWRRNQTVVRFGFHINQILGNIYMNTLAGVTPSAYSKAAKLLHGDGSVNIDGVPVQRDTLLRMAREDGILSTGSSVDFLNNLVSDLSTQTAARTTGQVLNQLNPLSERFLPGKWGRQASEWEDNMSRLAHYIHVLNRGGTRRQARDSTIKHLFDYSNLTGIERGIRVLIPFYAWMRHNIPFQIMNAVKRPGQYSIITDMQVAAQGEQPEIDPILDEMGVFDPVDRENVKQAIAENGGTLPDQYKLRGVQVPFTDNRMYGLSLPVTDIQELADDPIQYTRSSLNPLVQLGMGILTGQNTFGAPINRFNDGVLTDEYGQFVAQQLLGHPARAVGYGMDAVDAFQQGDNSKMVEELLRVLGVNSREVDPVKEIERIIYQRRREAEGRRNRAKQEQGQ